MKLKKVTQNSRGIVCITFYRAEMGLQTHNKSAFNEIK